MSVRLREFFRLASWAAIIIAVAATSLMVLAIFALPGTWATRVVSIIPASSMMLSRATFPPEADLPRIGVSPSKSVEEKSSSVSRPFRIGGRSRVRWTSTW